MPFCASRCPHCDFFAEASEPGDVRMDRYLAGLRREAGIRGEDALAGARTVYVGGGTPTWIGSARLAGLLRWVLATTGERTTPSVLEVTVEANPDSFDADTAKALADAGVTRVSLGVQSLDDGVLAALGRRHDAASACRAARAARDAGRMSLSLDLICGGPMETDASWEATLTGALGLQPDHVSVYALTLEPGTPLEAAVGAGAIGVADEDAVADRLDRAAALLARHGFARYEISNWARPGHECLHNLTYWQYGEYVGLGAGSVSRIGGRRLAAPRSVAGYLADIEEGSLSSWEEERLDDCLMARERAMLGLRLAEGIEPSLLHQIARHCGGHGVAEDVEGFIADGLLEARPGRLTLTPAGMSLANRVIADLTVP